MENHITELIGKTLKAIERLPDSECYHSEGLIFIVDNGEKYIMCHYNDCCESVTIDDIIGDLNDLIGSPILKASEDTKKSIYEELTEYDDESFTWTFYNIATIKGQVTIRWYGTSNGFYSESVDFKKLEE